MGKLDEVKEFYQKSKRVWSVLKKPTKDEFNRIAKISGMGVLIIGLLGFLISITMKMILG